MNSLGQEPTPTELAKMVELADADGSGDIDFVEFVTLIAHKMNDDDKEDADDKLQKAFAIFVRVALHSPPSMPNASILPCCTWNHSRCEARRGDLSCAACAR